MIEEFIQILQQAETEANSLIKGAQERVQAIQRDSESSASRLSASAESVFQLRLDPIDQKANEQMARAEDQFHADLKQQLDSLERQMQDRRGVALDFLLSRLTAR
jgi:vacuolar-type H+-ATPase subunit H